MKMILSVALMTLAPAIATANSNLVPEFNTKTGMVTTDNIGVDSAGRTLMTVSCSKQGAGSCPDVPAADIAPYENPAYPNAATVKMKPVKAGNKVSHTFPFYKDMVFAPGTYYFTVCADAGDHAVESNEGDNCVRIRHKVGRAALGANSVSKKTR